MTVARYYVTSDAMGSATAILDEDGNILERRSYEAFGEMTCMQPDGSPVEISPTGVDVGFQGQVRDEVTGLYQMGYRWYNPVLGRWLSRDPIGLEGGDNAFRFCDNNPCSQYDIIGLACCDDPCGSAIKEGLFDKYSDALGLTVCCDGKKYACSLPVDRLKKDYKGTLVADFLQIHYKCILAHEQVHVNDPRVQCDKSNGDIHAAKASVRDYDKTEADAYELQARCVIEHINECPSEQCRIRAKQVSDDLLGKSESHRPKSRLPKMSGK
jgi:RHS repeat-associated protein